jgi:hypothetical protein
MLNNKWLTKWISPSQLDNYKQFLTGVVYNYGDNPPEYTVELFINRLLRLEPVSYHLTAGTAFHKWLELAPSGKLPDSATVNDWSIICPPDVNIEISLPACREVKVSGIIGGIKIYGRVDGIDAIKVYDTKTTGKFDVDNYMNSMQYKAYLMMTGLDQFQYDIFQIDKDENNCCITLESYNAFVLYRYANMENEVTECVLGYWDLLNNLAPQIIDTAKKHNLTIKGLTL